METYIPGRTPMADEDAKPVLTDLELGLLEQPLAIPSTINHCVENVARVGFSGQELVELYRRLQYEQRIRRYDDRSSPAQYLD